MSAQPGSCPRISVITTVHNAESFLEPTLRSLLAQSFEDFEALIVDDGSSDKSVELIEQLALDDSRIRLIRQSNAGVASALNRGIREARADLIAFLDHDDLWHPQKLEQQLKCLESDKSICFVGCYSSLLDNNHRHLGWRFGTAAKGDVYQRMLVRDLVAGGSVILVRKSAIEHVGGFDTAVEIEGRSDWDLWLRLARTCNYSLVEEPLVGYTRLESNYSRDYQRMISAGKAVLNKAAANDPSISANRLRLLMARDGFGIFCLSLSDKNYTSARKLLLDSIALSCWPVVLSPTRWTIIALFVLAQIMPTALFNHLWKIAARLAFKITPGESFTPGKFKKR